MFLYHKVSIDISTHSQQLSFTAPYVLYKDLGDAYRLFDEMLERNSVSWSVMVEKNGCGDGEEMIKGDVE
ncbi:hypothetical protein Tco_0022012 [Tanacetum coccineum]